MYRQKTVLVVEDEPMIARVIGIRLRNAGYQTIMAGDGYEGVATAINHGPDAIVMDVRMPVKDGLTALAELQANDATKRIPVVMLSASLVDQATALNTGARFFITKPYEHKTLRAAVNAALTECGKELVGT